MSYPIQRIVAGIADLNARDLVLTEAIRLARRLRADLHLVHAFEIPSVMLWDVYSSVGYVGPKDLDQFSATLKASMEKLIEGWDGPARIICHAVPAPTAEAIQDVASEVDADLVLVGATRQGRLGRFFLGTTAQRVLRDTPTPVVVVRRPFADSRRRILLTTDLSESSSGVRELALEVVGALGSEDAVQDELRSLAVVDEVSLPPPLGAHALRQIALDRLERELAGVHRGELKVSPAVRVGDPAEEIASEAEEWLADLVVVGSHSRSGVERAMLGSVAEGVVRSTTGANVLVVPASTGRRSGSPGLQLAALA